MQFLTSEQKKYYLENGFLIIEDFVPNKICNLLMERAHHLIDQFAPNENKVIFSTIDQQHANQRYFLESGDKIHFFFEQHAFDASGHLKKNKYYAINKIGHALHDLDPVFNCFSRSHKIATLVKDLNVIDALLVQSMYICKQPLIGGEVTCHQDSSFLYAEGEPVIGLWFALEDATLQNGCLWAIPGGHTATLKSRFIRGEQYETRTEIYDHTPFAEEKMIPLPVPAGSLILLHGFLPHMSKENLSQKSRHAYTLHIMSRSNPYARDNWLQRSKDLPFQGFF